MRRSTAAAWVTAAGVLLALLITSGALSSLLVPPAPPGAFHGEGREVPDTTVQQAIVAQRDQAEVGRMITSQALVLLGAAAPPTYTFAGPTGDVVCDDLSAALPSDGHPDQWERRRSTTWIVVHSTGAEGDFTAWSLAQYHVGTLGWEHVGYSVNIRQSGRCELMLPPGVMDYAAFHYNPIGYHIHVSGLVNFTPAQYATLTKLVVNLALADGVPAGHIVGHRTLSQMDARDRAAGIWHQNYNDHVDPCASAPPCGFDAAWFGLRDAVAKARIQVPPKYTGYRPPQPRDDRNGPLVGSTVAGASLTYYSTESKGVPRCPRPLGPETVGLPWPVWLSSPVKLTDGIKDEHWAASYVLADGSPAWPCGTWLRVSLDGRHLDVRIADTGGFKYDEPALPNHVLDLSEAASARLLGRAGSATGTSVEVISWDDNFSRYVAESGFRVAGDFRPLYFPQAAPGGYARYGFPREDANYERWETEGLVSQRFEKAMFLYQNGRAWTAPVQ